MININKFIKAITNFENDSECFAYIEASSKDCPQCHQQLKEQTRYDGEVKQERF